MKTMSINDFTNKLPSKFLSDLYKGVHMKGTKYFGNKVMNRQLFHRKTIFHMKIFKKFDSKIINRQYFYRETGLKSWLISF